MNDDSVNTFFSLLRAGMYGTQVPEGELPESIDWDAVAALAHKHAVLGIIIDAVQFVPARLRPSAAITARMNKFALGLIQTSVILDNSLARLSSFLKQHSINGVLLKGQGVARYYRQPQMRQTGDIDFYVGKEQFKQAMALCKAELADATGECSLNEQHFDFYMEGVVVELHRIATRIFQPFRNRHFQRWITEELQQSPNRRALTVGTTEITLPSYDFDAIYIFFHAWRHYIMGGIGLRQLCDWAMVFYTHADDIDTEKLIENIRRFNITKGWKLFACIAVDHLGVAPEKIPLYDPAFSKKSEHLLEEILTGGNFGVFSKAQLRTPIGSIGLWNGLGKVRNVTGYFIAMFPIIPAEATFIYFNRMIFGTIANIKRSRNKSR